MKTIIIGKNSSVFGLVRSSLMRQIDLLELESQEAINQLEKGNSIDKENYIIFSGMVTENKNKLEEIERFHSLIAQKLSHVAVGRVILISSSAVYGNHKHIFSENDECKPISNYGKSKLNIEHMYLEKLHDSIAILRLGNVLGLDAVGKAFANGDNRSRHIDCRNDYSTPIRTYVDAQILSDIIVSYIRNFGNLPRKLNIGRRKPQSMHSAVQELGINFNLRITDSASRDLTLDTSQLFKILGRSGV